MSKQAKHAPLEQFSVINNALHIGSHSPEELLKMARRTPFYAYDKQAIISRVKGLTTMLPDRIKLHYAVKANPMPEVVTLLASLVNGMDVASLGELQLALNTSTVAKDVSFAGPGKTDEELYAAISADIIIIMESENEARRIATIGNTLDIQPAVAIRVNPAFELKTSGMKMGGGAKPFGIDAERIPQMLKDIEQYNFQFRGFHIFCGSQNLKAESIIEAQNSTFELAFQLSEYSQTPVTWLNIGGGFGIPYFPGELRLETQKISENLAILTKQARLRLPQAELIMELGRYLVGEAGIYVCRILDKKISRGTTYLVTDGGLHHHLAASGNFGQIIRKNYPVIAIEDVFSDNTEDVTVVGPLCTPLDILAENINLPKLEVGSMIGVLQSGAYGYSASPHQFLNHPPPIEIIV